MTPTNADSPRPTPPRLIDLHCDWLLQYAAEMTLLDPAGYPEIADAIAGPKPGNGRDRKRGGRYLRQAEGYLAGTSAAVVACYRSAADWAKQTDPWVALGEIITRVEAEFPGRVLMGPADLERWSDDPNGLCWAVIGIEGFDPLIRSPGDLDRLPALFERGARIFQPVYGPESVLGGSAAEGDDRGLTDLGRAFLKTLADLADGSGTAPQPALDLAHLNPRSMGEVLDWFESDPGHRERIEPIYSHGILASERFATPRAITLENLARLRALGGLAGFSVGPPFLSSPEDLRAAFETAAALPFRGRPGFEGLAIGTDFLGMAHGVDGLDDAPSVIQWADATFPIEAAHALLAGNARNWLRGLMGVRSSS